MTSSSTRCIEQCWATWLKRPGDPGMTAPNVASTTTRSTRTGSSSPWSMARSLVSSIPTSPATPRGTSRASKSCRRYKAPALERRHDFDARDVPRGVAGLGGIDDSSDLAIDHGDDDPVRVERVVVEATLGAVIPGSPGRFNHVAQHCSMQRVEELVIGLDRSQHPRNAPRGCQTLVEPRLNQSLTTRVRVEHPEGVDAKV